MRKLRKDSDMNLIHVGLGSIIAAATLYAGETYAIDSQSASAMTHKASASSSSSRNAARSATGDVKAIDAKALTLSNGEQFRLTNETEFDRNGQKITRNEVKPGEKVKAAYEARGNLAYAERVDITSSSAKQSGMGSGESSKSNAGK